MCDLRQDSCLFGHGGVDPACTQASPGVFGAFLHCDNCDKNRHRHLVPVLGTQHRGMFLIHKKNRVEIQFEDTNRKSGSYVQPEFENSGFHEPLKHKLVSANTFTLCRTSEHSQCLSPQVCILCSPVRQLSSSRQPPSLTLTVSKTYPHKQT